MTLGEQPDVIASELAERRARMVQEIEADVRDTYFYTGRKALDERVMAALAKVPRHEFVPPDMRGQAYRNAPLPIGHGQTISQPYIVALMTDLLRLQPEDIVLEVGTGCGYQTAILAELARRVFSIEIVESLGLRARELVERLGYANVETAIGDGYHGWDAHAPFDAIIVTAAAASVPPPLIEQLKSGGRMAIPVGREFGTQTLLLLEKDHQGQISEQEILPVAFVPLTGGH